MNRLIVGLLALAGTSAWADQLLWTPTATKIVAAEPRLDFFESRGHRPFTGTSRLGLGTVNGFDGFISQDRRSKTTFDLGYNFVPAFVDSAPGISVGVQDLGSRSASGYAVMSYKYGQTGQYNQDTPLIVTLGARTGPDGWGILALQVPFADQFRGIMTYDRGQLTAGLDVRPIPQMSLKWAFRESRTIFGLSWTQRF